MLKLEEVYILENVKKAKKTSQYKSFVVKRRLNCHHLSFILSGALLMELFTVMSDMTLARSRNEARRDPLLMKANLLTELNA